VLGGSCLDDRDLPPIVGRQCERDRRGTARSEWRVAVARRHPVWSYGSSAQARAQTGGAARAFARMGDRAVATPCRRPPGIALPAVGIEVAVPPAPRPFSGLGKNGKTADEESQEAYSRPRRIIRSADAADRRGDVHPLFVVDGAKALCSAIHVRWDKRGIIGRCQVHKTRNVKDHLPDHMHASVVKTLRQPYAMRDFKKANARLENLARRWTTSTRVQPRRFAGLVETLTVIKRWTCRNFKRWKGGTMILRWCCAAMRRRSHASVESRQRRAGCQS
jgi:hypothetical protein